MQQNNVKPTTKQIKTTNVVLLGETNLGKAMQIAGYSPKTSENPKQNFMESRGVQQYLQLLDEKAQKKFNTSVVEKAFDIYLHAMVANKYSVVKGKQFRPGFMEVPDHQTRMHAAEKIFKIYGIEKQQQVMQQNNLIAMQISKNIH